MKIRPYEERDEEAVAKLWREAFPDDPPWNVPEEDIRRKLQIQRELFLVSAIGEEIAGTAMAGYDGHRGWVYCVAVDPAHRRKGIGRALMDRVERDLTRMGCRKLNLQVRKSNEEAAAFYEKLGYSVEDRVSMGKLLEK
jgi:ribosomal protein S18 acetylase RimI-like enzyme